MFTFYIYRRLRKTQIVEEALNNSITDSIIIVDKKWNISLINQHAEALLLSDHIEINESTLWGRYPEFTSFFYKKLRFANTKQINEKLIVEGYYPPSNRWLKINTYRLQKQLALCITDITIDHLNHERVNWLSDLVDNLNEGVITIDRHGLIRSFNTIAEKMFGYTEKELIGNNIKCLTPDDISDKHDSFISRRVKTGKQQIIPGQPRELMGKHKNGSLFPIELSLNEQHINDELIFVGTIHDQSRHQKKIDEMEYSITHDPLTGAYNKYFLEGFFPIALSRAEKNSEILSVLFCDLDKFKIINDNHGHGVGDQLLQMVVERMQAVIRDTDLVIRWGGDEFVIILNEISDTKISSRVAKQLIEQLSEPFELIDNTIQIGCSIGISVYPDDGTTYDELMNMADKAMYSAKRKGRGIFQFATS